MVVHRPRPVPAHLGPVRTCVGCRARALASDLLRVVVEDGVVMPDPRRRRPGRGAWLHADPDCLLAATRRRAFSRAFRVTGALDAEAVAAYLARRSGDNGGVGTTHPGQEQGKQVDPS